MGDTLDFSFDWSPPNVNKSMEARKAERKEFRKAYLFNILCPAIRIQPAVFMAGQAVTFTVPLIKLKIQKQTIAGLHWHYSFGCVVYLSPIGLGTHRLFAFSAWGKVPWQQFKKMPWWFTPVIHINPWPWI